MRNFNLNPNQGKPSQPRIFHGNLRPEDLAGALVGEFNRGPLRAQQLGSGDQVVVQISSRDHPQAGGKTALSVHLQAVQDGVSVLIGSQSWWSVAASLGQTVFWTWRNPLNLINRLDDIAQDIESLQLSDRVWVVIENAARASGASFELSERLRRLVCAYCLTANPVGESSCIACGAPLGLSQPGTCKNCGFVVRSDEARCPNCGKPLYV